MSGAALCFSAPCQKSTASDCHAWVLLSSTNLKWTEQVVVCLCGESLKVAMPRLALLSKGYFGTVQAESRL